MLLLLGLAPLLAARGRRPRVEAVAAFAVAALGPLVALAGLNAARADDFTVVRGGSASLLFRTFVADRIVEPDNGAASAELARAVSRELLPNEPYRSRGIDLETFFSSGSSRMHDDLTVLSDRTWGWDDDYRHLGRVAREAIRAHPGRYARGVAKDLWRLLLWPLYGPVEATAPSPPGARVASRAAPSPAAPAPDDEPIPSSREAPYISTPDGRIREVWTSPTEHSFVFRYPADAHRLGRARPRGERAARGPARPRRAAVARRASQRPLAALPAAVHVAAGRDRRRALAPSEAHPGPASVLAASALGVMLSTSLAVYAVAEYSVPVVPAFVLLATAGLFGRPSHRAPHSGAAQRPALDDGRQV